MESDYSAVGGDSCDKIAAEGILSVSRNDSHEREGFIMKMKRLI